MRVSNRLGKMPGIYGLTNGAGVQGPVLQAEEGTELWTKMDAITKEDTRVWEGCREVCSF